MSAAGGIAVGIDLGGTGTRFVALGPGGDAVTQISVQTPVGLRPAEATAFVAEHVDEVAAGGSIATIGIGASGPIDADGVIRNVETLPAFTGVDLFGALSRRFSAAVTIDNDAVTAGVYEHAFGAARGYRSALVVTLGTGVGVCALIDGVPVRGGDGIHPEAGHLSLSAPPAPCYCGRSSCWEQLASRSALQRRVREVDASYVPDPAQLQAAADRAVAGDQRFTRVFDAYGTAIAEGLCDLLTVLRSECVVLGGSAAGYDRAFAPALRRRMNNLATYAPVPPVLISDAGDYAGAIGAAVVASRRTSA